MHLKKREISLYPGETGGGIVRNVNNKKIYHSAMIFSFEVKLSVPILIAERITAGISGGLVDATEQRYRYMLEKYSKLAVAARYSPYDFMPLLYNAVHIL